MFVGLEEIVMCLVENFSPVGEEKTDKERYEKIMRILFGEELDKPSNLKKHLGGQRTEFKKSYNEEDIYILMNFLIRFGFASDRTSAARTVLPLIKVRGIQENTIKRFAEGFGKNTKFCKFSARQKRYEVRRKQKQIRTFLESEEFKTRYSLESGNIDEVVMILRKNGWPIKPVLD